MLRHCLFILLIICVGAAPAGAQVSTTFDTDLDGWTVSGDNTHFWNPTGGNPDGCLEVPDNASGPWSTALSPIKFLGNWRDMTPSDSVSYDVLFLPTVAATGNPPAVFRVSGPGGVAIYDQSIPDSIWVHISAPLDSSFWNVQSGTWSDILKRVTAFEVAVEYRSGDETVRVDNILLTGTPTSVFDPCESATFEVSSEGWIGEGTANLSRQASDGDIGGYLQVSSSTGFGHVLLPFVYNGDWSGFDGIGSIGFSFAYQSGTIVGARELRLELSGPNGSAHVSKPSDDFLDYARIWHQLEWPLQEASWTMDSGTWAGLLSDVQEVAISADLATGSDTYRIDNFFRYGSGCQAVPVIPISIYEAGYSLCDRYPFRDASALALNSADGELYSLVNAGPSLSAGGGVYRLTGGPGRGVRMHAYSGAEGLVFTADGDGFVSEDGSGDLFRFVGTTSSELWVDGGIGFNSGDDDIAGLGVAPAGFNGANVSGGDLLVTDWGNGGPDGIWAVNPDSANGDRLLVPDPGSADFWDVVATTGGEVFVADAVQDNSLWKLRPDGTLVSVPISATITNMQALAYDSPGNAIYTMKTSSPLGLYRIDLADWEVTLIADGFDTVGRGNLEIDSAARKLYVADSGDNQIYTICLPTVVAVGEREERQGGLSLTMSPNPVMGASQLRFRLSQPSPVQVEVIDVAGRRVRVLSSESLPAGEHSLHWDGRDEAGRSLASGIYFLRVRANDLSETLRAVLLR